MTRKMSINAVTFKNGDPIPNHFARDGDNVSPALQWKNIPDDTQELALLVEDPDAPRAAPFVHWVALHIPADASGIPENLPHSDRIDRPIHLMQGQNDFGKIGYDGPAPPQGHGPH